MIVDIFMPDMRGFESIRIFHQRAPTVPLSDLGLRGGCHGLSFRNTPRGTCVRSSAMAPADVMGGCLKRKRERLICTGIQEWPKFRKHRVSHGGLT
jgi:hypothetical protein